MYGDTDRIRARCSALRATADELRTRAVALGARAASCTWTSSAGRLLQSRVEGTVADFMQRAHDLDAAADALEAHVRSADDAIALIARAGDAVLGSVRAVVR